MKISSILAGVSGEYFVAAELSRRGYICSVTLKNTKGIDILVCNEDSTKTLGIQVKTNQINKREWMLNEKSEKMIDTNIMYVFVNLISQNILPEFYIVPSKVVSDYITNDHKKWLSTIGKKGQQHNDSSMRKFKDIEQVYLNRWDLLNL
ncbi:hypothetical protein ACRZ9O_10465 [Aquirufa sp. HETE-40SA]